MITGENIDIIYLFLVSDLGFFAFSKFYTGPQFDATGFRYKKAYLDETYIPIPGIKMTKLLRDIGKNINNWQNIDIKINKVWFELIGLSNEEIEFVTSYKKNLLENSFYK